MNFLEQCKRTEIKDYTDAGEKVKALVRTLHHLDGLVTEIGELRDAYKKHIFYGTPLDRVNVVEEVGDIEYYLELFCDAENINREDARNRVINKLRQRYPEKFTQKDAIDRDLSKERAELNKK